MDGKNKEHKYESTVRYGVRRTLVHLTWTVVSRTKVLGIFEMFVMFGVFGLPSEVAGESKSPLAHQFIARQG